MYIKFQLSTRCNNLEMELNSRNYPIRTLTQNLRVFPVMVTGIAVGMNAFVAYVSVAFVQKILTSLNSTLPQRGQAVSVCILTGIYRSQSAFHRRYRPSRRNYRPRSIALVTRDNGTHHLLGSLKADPPTRWIVSIVSGRHFLIGRCWLNVFRYVARGPVLVNVLAVIETIVVLSR